MGKCSVGEKPDLSGDEWWGKTASSIPVPAGAPDTPTWAGSNACLLSASRFLTLAPKVERCSFCENFFCKNYKTKVFRLLISSQNVFQKNEAVRRKPPGFSKLRQIHLTARTVPLQINE
jgi:hypothetical protein